jgi:hypothetical protein
MMADRLTNVELLVMLSEDNVADNQDWSREVWKEGAVRARKVHELLRMLDKAREQLEVEAKRLAQYLPRQEEMPRVVTQGPKQ